MKRLFLLAIVLLWAATVSATIFIPSDSTDVSTTIFIEDKADGTTETGLTVTDFDLYYHIDGAAMAAKVDATSGSATAHTENSAIELGIGLYEIDWPDAIFASRDPGTLIDLIVEWDVSTHYAVVQQVQITPSVNTLLIEGADATTTLGTAQTGDSYALVNNETYGLSAIQALVADANDSCDLLSNGTYGLAAIRTRGDAAWITGAAAEAGWYVTTTVAAGTHTTTTLILTAGPAADHWWTGQTWQVTVVDADNSMPASSAMAGYVGSSRAVTLITPLPFTPAEGDLVYVQPLLALPWDQWLGYGGLP